MLNPIAAAARHVRRMTTGERIKAAQDRNNNLAAIHEVVNMRPANDASLQPADFRVAGSRYQIPAVRLHVLAEKETGDIRGFGQDGRLRILCLPHHFSKLTGNAFDVPSVDADTGVDVPVLSYPKFIPLRATDNIPAAWLDAWGRHPYALNQDEHWRLWRAWAKQNFDAAARSICMGNFRVMGEHWRAMGFSSAVEMIRQAYDGEAAQLDLCLRWFRINDRLDALRSGAWRDVAIYNGAANAEAYTRECAALELKRSGLYV